MNGKNLEKAEYDENEKAKKSKPNGTFNHQSKDSMMHVSRGIKETAALQTVPLFYKFNHLNGFHC